MPTKRDADEKDAAPAGAKPLLDGVQEAEAERVSASKVDSEIPDDIPGPRPPRSAPADPDAKMSTLSED